MDQVPLVPPPSSPPPEPDWDWLARFVAGELSDNEARWVRAWADADPAHASLLADVRRVWAASPGARRQWDAERALVRIKAAQTPVRVRRPASARFTAWSGVRWGAIAAAIVAAIGLVVVGTNRSGRPAAVATAREYAAARGERESVTLGDGTRIVIGPGSRMWLTVDSARRQREVRLDGEAMFTVRHDPKWMFVVQTARAVTRDLGTTFGVRDYTSDSAARVIVRDGRVALGAADTLHHRESATLVGGEMSEVGGDGRLAPVRRVRTDAYLGWAQGTLVLDGTPLRDALTEVARWYDVDVRLVDSAYAERRVSASFTTESAPEALQIIGDAVGLAVERRGTALVLVRRSHVP